MKILPILFILLTLFSCGESAVSGVYTPNVFYIESNLYPDAGSVGSGIDFVGYFKDPFGAVYHTTKFTCAKYGHYKYTVIKNFMNGKFSLLDKTGTQNILGEYITNVSWESNVVAGTERVFKAEQNGWHNNNPSEYAFVVRVVRK